MTTKYILTDYVESAMAGALYDKLEDGSFAGEIPACPGVVAFARTLSECESELRSVLEEWLLMGLKFGHFIPIIANMDLNQEPVYG